MWFIHQDSCQARLLATGLVEPQQTVRANACNCQRSWRMHHIIQPFHIPQSSLTGLSASPTVWKSCARISEH
jgi:hypothetical protein